MGDFRVFAQTARLRETSPTLDRGECELIKVDQLASITCWPILALNGSKWLTVAPAGAIGIANPPATMEPSIFRLATIRQLD